MGRTVYLPTFTIKINHPWIGKYTVPVPWIRHGTCLFTPFKHIWLPRGADDQPPNVSEPIFAERFGNGLVQWWVRWVEVHESGQILMTSHHLTPNGGLVREMGPLISGKSRLVKYYNLAR